MIMIQCILHGRRNRLGDNVLHYAVMRQRLDMVHKLLRMGLDPTASTPGGANGSPLDLAKKDSSPAGVEIAEVLTRAWLISESTKPVSAQVLNLFDTCRTDYRRRGGGCEGHRQQDGAVVFCQSR